MSGTFPIGTGATPNWPAGYVPSANEWSSWWSNKLDTDDPTLEGGPFLPLGGGTMAGELILAGAPVNPLDAATKAYVDSITPAAGPFLPTAGGTMTGTLTLAGNPVGNLDAATRQYVDAVGTTAGSALNVANAAVPKTGGVMTGPLTLSGNPTAPLGAATKQYVDQFLPLSGGTVNGNVSVTGNLQGGSVFASNAFYANAFNGWEWNFTVDANGSKFESFRSGWNDSWNGTSGTRSWNGPSGSLMNLDGGGNLNLKGILSSTAITVGTSGINYSAFSGNHMAFGWNGNINCYVDGTYEGDIAVQGWVNGALGGYLPLGGGHITGSIGVDGPSTFNNNLTVNSSATVASNFTCYQIITTLTSTHSFSFWSGGANLYCREDGATDWTIATVSDERIKRDIQPTAVDCLALMRRIPLYEYRLSEERGGGRISVGFVAQRQAVIFPESVVGEVSKSIDLNPVVAALVGAVQQLAGRLDHIDHAAREA
jgi:hypothetical protein